MTQESKTEDLLTRGATSNFNFFWALIGLFQKYHNTLCFPFKILHNYSYKFLLRGDYKLQEKLKTMLIQNFGGKTNSIMVFFKKAFLYFAWDKH